MCNCGYETTERYFPKTHINHNNNCMTKHWCNEELCKQLFELGVTSQFNQTHQIVNPRIGTQIPMYHFSDIMLPENVETLWGDTRRHVIDFLGKIVEGEDWEEWLAENIKA